MKRCVHGKLKHPVGKRRCKRARASKRHTRKAKRSYRKAAGVSAGVVGLFVVGAAGAYTYFSSQNA